MYKLIEITKEDGSKYKVTDSVQRISDLAFIPLHPDNTDFQTFVKELTVDFTILQDADGKPADQGTIKAILKIRNNQ
jgi:hypothetical protein